MIEIFPRIFTLEIDGRPTLAFEARGSSEAQQIRKETWLLDDLANLKTSGAPLRAQRSKLSVRRATSEETAIFEQVAEEPSGDMTLAFLIELDARKSKS